MHFRDKLLEHFDELLEHIHHRHSKQRWVRCTERCAEFVNPNHARKEMEEETRERILKFDKLSASPKNIGTSSIDYRIGETAQKPANETTHILVKRNCLQQYSKIILKLTTVAEKMA